jgi:hypothetical protein
MSRNEKTGTIPQPYMNVRYPLAKYSDNELGMHEEFCMYRGHRARGEKVFDEMDRRGFFEPGWVPKEERE